MVCCINITVIGNLNNQTVKEIWHGKEFESLRECFSKGIIPDGCIGCPLIKGK